MLISNNPPFAFRLRRERIDWKMLASVDTDRVAREVDFQTLQDCTANVTFCDIQAEFDASTMDRNFIKLFCLAQLIIEYLIYSQDCLSSALSSSEQESSKLSKQVADLELKLKKEKSRKKIEDGNPPYIFLDNGSQCKCSYCPKVFVNQTFLHMHHERRHSGLPLATPIDAVSNNPTTSVDLENELFAIKERLKLAENNLKEKTIAMEIASEKERNHILQREAEMHLEIETWKAEQLKAHKQDLENAKDLFQKELDFFKEKYVMLERQLQEVQQKTVMMAPNLNPAVVIAEGKDTTELIKKQQHEIMELKELMKQQVVQMGDSIKEQLMERDNYFESKVRQIEDKYYLETRKEIERSKAMNNQQLLNLPDMESSLNRQIKELEKLNGNQKKRESRPKRHKSQLMFISTPIEDIMGNTRTVTTSCLAGDMEEINHGGGHSMEISELFDSTPLATYETSVRHNPIIIQGLRDEVSNLLDEKLEMIGISKDANGIREYDLKRNLLTSLNDRPEAAQDYKIVQSLREQLQLKVNQEAELKLKESRRSSSKTSKARSSIMKILADVKEKVTSVHSRSGSFTHPQKSSLS